MDEHIAAMVAGGIIAILRLKGGEELLPVVEAIREGGSGGDRQHVVRGDDQVGDDDDPNGFPHVGAGPDLVLPLLGGLPEELPGDPGQKQPSPQPRGRHLEKEGGDVGQGDPKGHGINRPQKIPHFCCRGGRDRTAKAITMALFPDRMKFT